MTRLARALLLAAALGGCEERPRPRIAGTTEELVRTTSPDSVVDAVLTRTNSHATVPYGYRVYVVARGAPAPREEGWEVLRADHVDAVSLAWPRVGLLEIRYARARIFHFTNFWEAREVRNFTYKVEILLRPRD